MKKKLQPISPEEIAELSELRDNLINMPLEQAEKAALRMQHIIKTRSFAKDIKIYTSTLFVLAEYSARNGKYEQSTDIFKQLLSLAESHKLPDDKLRAKANLAIIQAQTGHLREALEVWEEILQMEEDPVRRIDLINNICMAYGCLEDYESAIKYGYQVLDIADENNLEKMKVSPLINLGTAYHYMEDHKKALIHWEQSLHLIKKYDLKNQLCSVMNNISLAYNSLHKKDKSLEYAFECLRLREENHTTDYGKASPLNNIGFIYETAGENDKALEYYEQALQSYGQTPPEPQMVNIVLNQASIFLKQGKHDQSLAKLKEAQDFAKGMDTPVLNIRLTKLYSDVYAAMQDFEKAYKYQSEFREILEKKLDQQSKNSISKTEADYYLKKIEKQAQIYKVQNTELKKKNKIIRQTTRDLKESNRTLSGTIEVLNWIIAVITHDVRAPLGNFSRVLSMMLAGDFEPSEHEEILESLKRSSDNVFKLINEMLDGIRLQRRKLGFLAELEIRDIIPILHSIIGIYLPIAQQKSINLQFSHDAEQIKAKIDSDLLKIVVRNLLNNAVKFTPEHGKISLAVTHSETSVQISITDNGIGMSKREVQTLRRGIGPLRASNLRNGDGGVGLGFNLSRDALKKMKAKLMIDSIPDQGTTIKIQLPAK